MRKRTESLSLKLPGRQPMVLLHLLFYALFRERIVELCMLLSILRENFIKVMNWIYWTFLRVRKIRRHVIGIGPDIFRQYSMLNPLHYYMVRNTHYMFLPAQSANYGITSCIWVN